jgi:MFS family permease
MRQTFHRDRFTWLAYFALAFYGYFLNIFGPIGPYVISKFQLTDSVYGLHLTAFAAGMLLIGFAGHLLIQWMGRWTSLWVGMAGISWSVFLLLVGGNPIVTIAASFLMGLIGSLILAIIPSSLADQHGEMRAVALSEANVISSLIASAGGVMVGWAATLTGSWKPALGIVALAPLFLFLILGKNVSLKTTSTDMEATQSKQNLSSLFWVYWLAIVLAVSVEFCMVSWSASYLERVAGMTNANAAQAGSLFLIGMIVGRAAGSRLVQRFSTQNVVLSSIITASAGFLIFWRLDNVLLVLIGLFLAGLGVASMYPLLLSLAIGAADGNTSQASARATLASGTAILILPWVLGKFSDVVGIRSAYSVVLILIIGVFLVSQLAGRISTTSKAIS